MARELLQGLGKLLSTGATFLQHQQFAERLRGMQLEDAKTQLASYVRGMPDAGFNALKLALTVLAKGNNDPSTGALLNGLLGSLDTARNGRAPAPLEVPTTALRMADTAPVRSFDDNLAMVASWYELDEDGRVAALSAHLIDLTPDAFRTFRAHMSQAINNVADEIRQHEANENQSWGGSAEDRMSYMFASLKTGQRDPAFLAHLRELRAYGPLYAWVAEASDVVWEERERRLRELEFKAPTDIPPAPTGSPTTVRAQTAAFNDDSWETAMAMLRAQLQEGLARGEIRPERRVSYERLIDKMESLIAPLSDPSTAVDEKAKLLERFRGLMAEFQQAYVAPGRADRLDAVSESARAGRLETYIAEMKGLVFRELAQAPLQHTADRAGELIGDLTRAHQEVARLTDDDAAIAFEREMLRATAKGLHDFTQREHLMLVRPLWQSGELMASPHGLFYAGRADLAETVCALAGRLRLDIPSARGQYYGQARWDALRSCHVGVYDLRGYRPGLVRTDAAAAALLAATAYELGLACALGKPVVIVTRSGDALPFDVDIAACELSDNDTEAEHALADALDRASYVRQRTTGASSLRETFAFLDRITQDHPRRKMLEATGLLNAEQIEDAIGFTGSVKQILREQSLGDLQAIFPAWAGRYPDAAMPTVFHVMPFSEAWSDGIRDAARAAITGRGYNYRRGDEADEGRIIEAIWDDICGAHVILVDLTGLNLNVFMELGMAHALGRTVLTVRQAGLKEPLPRNIEKLRVLDYVDGSALTRLLENRLAAQTVSA